MKSWIALFRGINVMGNNMLPMKDLAVLLQDLKFRQVRTYIQSGNAVFASVGTAASLTARIGARFERQLDFRPYVVPSKPASLLGRSPEIRFGKGRRSLSPCICGFWRSVRRLRELRRLRP